MKEFNKTQELLKLRIKQNKNTYIKRISIILSCVILLVGIIMFTFAKFESNKSYTLIQGKLGDYSSGDITLSYVVDGVSQSVPPQKGTGYKLKQLSCTNADGTWDKKGWGVYVNNITGKAKCNLEFETVTEVEVTLYSAAVDEVYYYDNGEKVVLGTTDSTGKLENVALEPNNITLYSSVAKNPDNLSEDYSKLISVDDETTDVYVMPSNAYYWYGYKISDVQNLNSSGSSNYTNKGHSLSFNTNDASLYYPPSAYQYADSTFIPSIDLTSLTVIKAIYGSMTLGSYDITSLTGDRYIGVYSVHSSTSYGSYVELRTSPTIRPNTELIRLNNTNKLYAIWLE